MRPSFAVALLLLAAAVPAGVCRAQGPGAMPDTSLLSLSRLQPLVAGRLAAAGFHEPTGTVVVRSSPGSAATIRLVASTLPDSAVPVLQGAVNDFVRELPTSDDVEISFVLARGWGAVPAIAEGERWDPPSFQNGDEVRAAMTAVLLAHPDIGKLRRTRWPPAVLRLRVDEDGTVAFAHVLTRTGDPHLDRYLLALAHRFRFRPARAGSGPFRCWVQVPLTFLKDR